MKMMIRRRGSKHTKDETTVSTREKPNKFCSVLHEEPNKNPINTPRTVPETVVFVRNVFHTLRSYMQDERTQKNHYFDLCVE
jgi:hypothetical protein